MHFSWIVSVKENKQTAIELNNKQTGVGVVFIFLLEERIRIQLQCRGKNNNILQSSQFTLYRHGK